MDSNIVIVTGEGRQVTVPVNPEAPLLPQLRSQPTLRRHVFFSSCCGWIEEGRSMRALGLSKGDLIDAFTVDLQPDPILTREIRRDRMDPRMFRFVNNGGMAIGVVPFPQ